jgi:hypothetical protein
MESEGFTVYEFEWWHFDHKDWKHYLILKVKQNHWDLHFLMLIDFHSQMDSPRQIENYCNSLRHFHCH